MHSEENMISCATILLLLFYFLLVPGRLHSVVILNETKAPNEFTPHSLSGSLQLYIYIPPCDFKDYLKKKKMSAWWVCPINAKQRKKKTGLWDQQPGPLQPDAAKYTFKCVLVNILQNHSSQISSVEVLFPKALVRSFLSFCFCFTMLCNKSTPIFFCSYLHHIDCDGIYSESTSCGLLLPILSLPASEGLKSIIWKGGSFQWWFSQCCECLLCKESCLAKPKQWERESTHTFMFGW